MEWIVWTHPDKKELLLIRCCTVPILHNKFCYPTFFYTNSVQLRYEGLLLMMAFFYDGHFSWWLLNDKLRKTTMLLTQCTVHIWDYPVNNNHNVQLGVAKECWVAKLVLQNANFSQNCTTSNSFSLRSVFLGHHVGPLNSRQCHVIMFLMSNVSVSYHITGNGLR